MVELKSEKIGTVQADEVTAEFNRLYKAMEAELAEGYSITRTELGNGEKFVIKTEANSKLEDPGEVLGCVTCTMVNDRYTRSLYLGV